MYAIKGAFLSNQAKFYIEQLIIKTKQQEVYEMKYHT